MSRQTIEVPLRDFALWQAQLAHAASRATNNPDVNAAMINRAHRQMRDALVEYHENIEGDVGRSEEGGTR